MSFGAAGSDTYSAAQAELTQYDLQNGYQSAYPTVVLVDPSGVIRGVWSPTPENPSPIPAINAAFTPASVPVPPQYEGPYYSDPAPGSMQLSATINGVTGSVSETAPNPVQIPGTSFVTALNTFTAVSSDLSSIQTWTYVVPTSLLTNPPGPLTPIDPGTTFSFGASPITWANTTPFRGLTPAGGHVQLVAHSTQDPYDLFTYDTSVPVAADGSVAPFTIQQAIDNITTYYSGHDVLVDELILVRDWTPGTVVPTFDS